MHVSEINIQDVRSESCFFLSYSLFVLVLYSTARSPPRPLWTNLLNLDLENINKWGVGGWIKFVIFFAWKYNISDLSGYQTDLDIEKVRKEKAALIQNRKKIKELSINTKLINSDG